MMLIFVNLTVLFSASHVSRSEPAVQSSRFLQHVETKLQELEASILDTSSSASRSVVDVDGASGDVNISARTRGASSSTKTAGEFADFLKDGMVAPESFWVGHPQPGNEVDLLQYRGFQPERELFVPPFPLARPGHLGQKIVMDPSLFNQQQKDAFDKGWETHRFNQYASDLIGPRREIPDCRPRQCRKKVYPSKLPTASVVICFHNEAFSALTRSIQTVIDRSPEHLIHEVILVDDGSDQEHLKKPLEVYLAQLPKLRLIRVARVGLIRARLVGAAVASGDVLIFLDSHIEATPHWLEPLLGPIAQSRTTVICPTIDTIDAETLAYNTEILATSSMQVGGFDWALTFNWHFLPSSDHPAEATDPLKSPTMAGGLFAIDREYFDYLGAYDEGMDIWGAENLEISFRIWMCGGQLVISPCSRVGHIFRKSSAYKWRPGKDVLKINNIRLAEVWLDEYKLLYEERIGHTLGEFGSISERLELRKRLQCHSFKWYLHTVYPSLFVPSEAVARGAIRNQGDSTWCIDAPSPKEGEHPPVILYSCHGQGGNQLFYLSQGNEIRRDEQCFDSAGMLELTLYGCHSQRGNQQFVLRDDGSIYHPAHDKCIDLGLEVKKPLLVSCSGEATQKWAFHSSA